MPSPFPGMDPYLEDPAIWSGVHIMLLAAIQEQLASALRPRYTVRFARHAFTDADGSEASQASLLISETGAGRATTAIELPTPSNKIVNSPSRESFLRRRPDAQAADMNSVEIDLLREGIRTTQVDQLPLHEYLAFASRSDRDRQTIWPIRLYQRLPIISVPLKAGEQDIGLDLQAAVSIVIERGSYDLDFDYSTDPTPPLTPEQSAWAKEVIANHYRSESS